MKFVNQHLNTLAGGQPKILVFDCEFWHVLEKDDDDLFAFPSTHDFFFVSREIGGFMLTKNKDNSWSYKNPFFVTLPKPEREVSFPISKYATVEASTAKELDKLEKKLGSPWGTAFPSRLSAKGNAVLEQGLKVYADDDNIKRHRRQPKAWYSAFMKHYSKSTIIVKGTGDIDALKNASVMYGFDYLPPKRVVDIALWNKQSRTMCETAKLEGTFNCISKHLDKGTQDLASILPLEKAHDPSTDASMTLLVAMYIASQP